MLKNYSRQLVKLFWHDTNSFVWKQFYLLVKKVKSKIRFYQVFAQIRLFSVTPKYLQSVPMHDSVQFPSMNFFTRLFSYMRSIYAVVIQCLVILALIKLSNIWLKTFFLFYTIANKTLKHIYIVFAPVDIF